jgi:hypothetical protein
VDVGIALSGLLVSGLYSRSLASEEDIFHVVAGPADMKKIRRLKFAMIVRFHENFAHIVPIQFSVLGPLGSQKNTYLLPVRHFFDSRIAIVGFINSRSRY